MNILFSSKPWNKKVDTFNYFDLDSSDPRKAQLDQYFVGKTRPEGGVVIKSEKLVKKAPRSVK